MKISELKSGQGKVDIDLTIKSMSEPRIFNKFGKDLKVANAIVMDETGEMTLSLWNDDIDKVKAGDKIKIVNGYVSEFNGSRQLTPGKFGKLEVVSGSSKVKEEPKEKKGKKEAKKEEAEEEEEFEEQEF